MERNALGETIGSGGDCSGPVRPNLPILQVQPKFNLLNEIFEVLRFCVG